MFVARVLATALLLASTSAISSAHAQDTSCGSQSDVFLQINGVKAKLSLQTPCTTSSLTGGWSYVGHYEDGGWTNATITFATRVDDQLVAKIPAIGDEVVALTNINIRAEPSFYNFSADKFAKAAGIGVIQRGEHYKVLAVIDADCPHGKVWIKVGKVADQTF